MKLAELHQAFIAGIYGLDSQSLPSDFIKMGRVLSPEDSLSVYRGSVYGNLSSALADIYPAFVQCVGEEFFNALALRYVKAHPSRSASLDNYGEEFPNFVGEFKPLESLPYAQDLANLEWFWHLAFHAKDEVSLDPVSLQTVPEDHYDDLVFSLLSSAHLMTSSYPVHQIWRKCLGDQEDDDQVLNLENQVGHLLIWRAEGYEIRVDILSSLEHELLSLVNKKLKLGTILEQLLSKHSQEDINEVLTRAVQQGWFTGFTVSEQA